MPIENLAYPVGTETDLVVTQVGEPIEAINKVMLTLVGFERTDDEIQFTWRTENPTAYQAYVHIGNPPVIGSDGIVYGLYRAPHLVDTPITLANSTAEWTTSVAVPADVQGLYALPAVESKQQKNYVSHAIDAQRGLTEATRRRPGPPSPRPPACRRRMADQDPRAPGERCASR